MWRSVPGSRANRKLGFGARKPCHFRTGCRHVPNGIGSQNLEASDFSGFAHTAGGTEAISALTQWTHNLFSAIARRAEQLARIGRRFGAAGWEGSYNYVYHVQGAIIAWQTVSRTHLYSYWRVGLFSHRLARIQKPMRRQLGLNLPSKSNSAGRSLGSSGDARLEQVSRTDKKLFGAIHRPSVATFGVP